MSNTRYKPRLKKGVLGNKRFVLSTKKLTNLQKRKWQILSKTSATSQSFESLIRNDVLLVQNKTFDLRKNHKKSLVLKQQLFAFFGTFRKKRLANIFSSKVGVNRICDFIEMRLDMILVRSKLAKTLSQARWCISSGFVLVNATSVRVHSHSLHVGDLICLKHKEKPFFNSMVFNLPPDFLEVNYQTLSVAVVNYPGRKNYKEMIKLYHFFFGLEEIVHFNKIN
jgi:ribosomal protein S4